MRLAPGGWRYAAVPGVLAVPAFFVTPFAAGALLLVGGFALWFFRDPERSPAGEGVVSPADGTVSVVREEAGRLRVGVFMNVDDVHVNRAPLGGTVEAVDHRAGAHRPAFSKDSDRNEQLRLDFGDHTVVLIAGWFARRITPYVEPGDTLERAERLGHIAFGSRADVVLPAGYEREHLHVAEGDTVRAGRTVIARR
ncbi:MAG: protein sorting system archaetidylserine decarboxylase [Halobacteriales archaeon]|nr:protein sorting system archaetidylserine decarboxylase [Halobacteriales archaeon]